MIEHRYTPTGAVTTIVVAAVLFFWSLPAAAQGGITFSLDNLEVTGERVTFDVLARAEKAGSRLGDAQVYLAYNASAFGNLVRAAERISATLGDAFTGAGAYSEPIINDNDATRVSLTAEFLGDAAQGVSISGDPVVLLHVTMRPVDGGGSASIGFDEPLMEGQQYTSDLTAFTGVIAGGILEGGLKNIISPVLQVREAGDGAVQLDWTAAGEAGSFEVERAEGDGFRHVAFIEKPIDGERFAHRVEGLELGTHQFRLRQTDEAGNVTYSEIAEVTVEMVERFLLDPVYPNPFNPQATVRFAVKEAEVVRIELYNALGQRVRVLYDDTPQAGTYQEVRLDGSDLASGLYIVRLQGESFAATQRVMLMK